MKIKKNPAMAGFFCLSFYLFCCTDFRSFLRRLCGFRAAGAEFLHLAGRVDELFRARVERVAVRANFHLDVFLGGADNIFFSAGALDGGLFVIFRMDISFHIDGCSSADLPAEVLTKEET